MKNLCKTLRGLLFIRKPHKHMTSHKVLILVKKGSEYTSPLPNSTMKAGLLNSANFLKETLINKLDIPAELEICIDGNSIDRFLHIHKPTHCIIEAIWATPAKLQELTNLHPDVLFIVRVHSKIPFLANEGVAIEWIKAYTEIDGHVRVAFNNQQTSRDFEAIEIKNDYLPNLYKVESDGNVGFLQSILKLLKSAFEGQSRKDIHIGCFGAIRPLKNQLLQAVIALQYADKNRLKLTYHINGTRVEQRGETVLKNIRALFVNTEHTLVEHPWMPHDEFLKVVEAMDLGLQLSYTESFNIVTADFVASKVPIVVGKDIEWMNKICKCDPNNTDQIIEKMEYVMSRRHAIKQLNLRSLLDYNEEALETWRSFFKGGQHSNQSHFRRSED